MVHLSRLVFPLLAAALAAQSPLPLPASHTASEGSTSTNVPFGRSTPVRVQYVYDAMLFTGPVTITAVAFRADGGTVVASKLVDCEIHMSTSPLPLTALSTTFAQNRGANDTVVLPQQILTLPAQTAPATTPNAFLPAIPLATPFAYDPAQGALVLEIVVFGQPPGAYQLDATYVCDSPEVPIGPMSCLQTNGLPLRVESATTQVIWGRPWIARALDAVPGSFCILALGSIESGAWGGFLLPQDLTGFGGPGCYLSIDILGTWVAVAAGDGSAQFPFVVPNVPSLVGEWIRYQAAEFAPQANPLGLVTSQAKKVQVCGWEPVGRLWASGAAPTTGTREIGVATVLELTVQ